MKKGIKEIETNAEIDCIGCGGVIAVWIFAVLFLVILILVCGVGRPLFPPY